jgi:hypothetical protein
VRGPAGLLQIAPRFSPSPRDLRPCVGSRSRVIESGLPDERPASPGEARQPQPLELSADRDLGIRGAVGRHRQRDATGQARSAATAAGRWPTGSDQDPLALPGIVIQVTSSGLVIALHARARGTRARQAGHRGSVGDSYARRGAEGLPPPPWLSGVGWGSLLLLMSRACARRKTRGRRARLQGRSRRSAPTPAPSVRGSLAPSRGRLFLTLP